MLIIRKNYLCQSIAWRSKLFVWLTFLVVINDGSWLGDLRIYFFFDTGHFVLIFVDNRPKISQLKLNQIDLLFIKLICLSSFQLLVPLKLWFLSQFHV
jgi:hypothetical protein